MTSTLLPGTCICGLQVRAHRLDSGRQISCADAARRLHEIAEPPDAQVEQPSRTLDFVSRFEERGYGWGV